MFRRSRNARPVVVAVLLVATALGVLSAPAAGTRAVGGDRIVFGSACHGVEGAYSMLPDGSGLARLVPQDRQLTPLAVSRDGGTIVYRTGGVDSFTTYRSGRSGAIYVSRADGTALHLVVRSGRTPALSPDGKQLAFVKGGSIWIVGTDGRGLRRITSGRRGSNPDWSPDGKALVFADGVAGGDFIQPLHGRRRAILPVGARPKWSPDGRWIADDGGKGLRVIRSDGSSARRLAPLGQTYSWSPDSRSIAFVPAGGDVVVVGTNGRGLRRPAVGPGIVDVMWSPDGRLLTFTDLLGQPPQLLVVGSDGRGVRHLTAGCFNTLVGWTAPTPSVTPSPPSERVVDAETVATRDPVTALSADGLHVAFFAQSAPTECEHTALWTPGETSVHDLGYASIPCGSSDGAVSRGSFALAGSRVAWDSIAGSEDERGADLESATLADPAPVGLSVHCCLEPAQAAWDYHLHADGDLLVFNNGTRLIRIGSGSGPCPDGSKSLSSTCTTLRSGADAAPVESVSAGLIATLKPGAVTVLDAQGKLVRVVRFVPADVSAARLDGDKLVVWRFGRLERYDVATGVRELSRPLTTGFRLGDVDGGIAVLLSPDAIMLLRLDDGHSLTLKPGRGPLFADLEAPGLYYSYASPDGGGQVVFLPRSKFVAQLDSGTG